MAEKNIKTRIQHKHDTEVNWNKATGFIPKVGELIVYDTDETYSYPRFKVGDGITSVVNLAFVNEQVLSTQVIHGEDKIQLSDIIDDNLSKIDNISWEDLKDKPFYESSELTEIYSDTISWSVAPDGGYGNIGLTPAPFTLIEGETYRVIIDDNEFKTICFLENDARMLEVIIENELVGIMAGSFIIAYLESDDIVLIKIYGDASTHTVAIYHDTSFVKVLDEKFLPPVKASWNDLTDKPFYEEISEVEIFAEQDLAFVQNDNFGGLYTASTLPVSLIEGEEYIVEWCGERYSTIATYYEALGGNGIGNAGLLGVGDVTSEPFAIGTLSTGTMMFTTNTGSSNTVAIYHKATTVKTIDPKFLPEGSSSGSSLPEVTTGDAGKFLRVSSTGVWAVETVPNAEEASF